MKCNRCNDDYKNNYEIAEHPRNVRAIALCGPCVNLFVQAVAKLLHDRGCTTAESLIITAAAFVSCGRFARLSDEAIMLAVKTAIQATRHH